MNEILHALAEQQDELSALLTGLDEQGWHRGSPCPGWDVADVVLHLVQTNDMAIASAEGRLAAWFDQALHGLEPGGNVDDGAGAMVDAHRGEQTSAELRAAWDDGARHLLALLTQGDPSLRVDWVAGQLSLHTLTTTRLAETWIHTTDVARALDVDLVPTDRLQHIARLAWRTLPYAFRRAGRPDPGPVAFELTGPGGDAWTFAPDKPAATTVRGAATELCAVAGQRRDAADTDLVAEGPDGPAVLELVRTFA